MSEQTQILCVDDERNVLRSLERIFLDDDYVILTAASGEQGLELLEASPQIQVVISDFRMPGMNGVEFLKKVFMKRPDTIRIVLSGYADTAAVVAAINEGKIYKFIPKPWNDDELKMTVVKALEHFASNRRSEQLAEELRVTNEELRRLNATLEEQVAAGSAGPGRQNNAGAYAAEILDCLPLGVIGLSGDGRVLQVNREAALFLDLLPDRVRGDSMARVLPVEICVVADEARHTHLTRRTVRVNGEEFHVVAKGMAMAEPGDGGCILTITRSEGGVP